MHAPPLRKYLPSGGSEDGAALFLVAMPLLLGAVAGLLLHAIGQYFRLLLIWPALMGAAGGLAGWHQVFTRKVRAPLLAGLGGLLGGVAAWSSDQGAAAYRTYTALRENVVEIATDLQAGGKPARDVDGTTARLAVWLADGADYLDQRVVAALTAQAVPTGDGVTVEAGAAPSRPALAGALLRLQLQAGTTISRHGSDTRFGSTGTAVLWGLELLVVAIVGLAIPFGRAREPFCEGCGQWFGSQHRVTAPTGPYGGAKDAKLALRSGDHEALVRLATAGPDKKGFLSLHTRRCPQCTSGDQHLRLMRHRVSGQKTQSSDVVAGILDVGATDTLFAAIDAARAQAAGTRGQS